MKRITTVHYSIAGTLIFLFAWFLYPAWAAEKIYIAPETTITWTDAANQGVDDELLDLGGAAAGTSTMGSYADLGGAARTADYAILGIDTASRALDYEYEMTIDGFDSTPVIGETVVLYWSQSNGTTNFDGNPLTDPTDTVEGITGTDTMLVNLMLAGAASVYSTSTTNELKISGMVRLPLRYVSPVVHNNTADALESSGDVHSVKLTPIPDEVQRGYR